MNLILLHTLHISGYGSVYYYIFQRRTLFYFKSNPAIYNKIIFSIMLNLGYQILFYAGVFKNIFNYNTL